MTEPTAHRDPGAMDCARVVRDEVTEQYVSGRLSEADQTAFEQHYFQCARCFEELRTYRLLRAELESVAASEQPSLLGVRRRWIWSLAAAAVIVASALTWRELRIRELPPPGGPTPAQPTEQARAVSLVELSAVTPPPYQAVRLRSTADAATRRFREAMTHYERGDYTASAKGLSEAAKLDPSQAHTYFYLGASRLLSGNTDPAINALQAAINLGDSGYLEESRFYLAKAFLKKRQLDEARAELLKTVELKGDRERDARTLLEALDVLRRTGAEIR